MGNGASGEIEIFADGELEDALGRQGGDLSVKKVVEKSYNDVIRSVIRPPRARYAVAALGDAEFPLPRQIHAESAKEDEDDSRVVRRRDFELLNERELALRCSHWQVFASATSETPLRAPCLVYLHSNVGSRVDGLRVRDAALARGFSVLAFDCSGSGQSDGIYVTSGWNESKDLHFVLRHLDDDDAVSAVCFYAHSMGTFLAIVNVACRSLVASKKTRAKLDKLPSYFRDSEVDLVGGKPIKGMVLDGAYSKMAKVTEELMGAVQDEGFHIPTAMLKLACAVIQKSVKKRADVDLDLLRPIDYVGACFIPALFVAGTNDRYVQPHHSDKLAAKYGGPAVVSKVDGDHYTPRAEDVYAAALDFLYGSVRSAAGIR